jgi:hypothetical protein
MRDLYHNVLATQVLSPVTATATKTSTGADLKGYNSASVVFNIGQTGDTLSGSIYWTLTVEESDDDVSYSTVALADLHNSAASAVVNSNSLDETAYSFGYKGSKRYIRGVATKTGTHSNGTPMGILVLRGTPAYAPVA